MMITKTFTDIYGETHTDAIIKVVFANVSGSYGSSYNEHLDGSIDENEYANSNLELKAVYFKTQEDLDAGKTPRLLLSSTVFDIQEGTETQDEFADYSGMVLFRVHNLTEDYTGTALDKAYKFLTDKL